MTTAREQRAVEAATGMAALHECRSQAELDRRFGEELAGLLPSTDLALCRLTGDGSGAQVKFVVGAAWQILVGAPARATAATTWLPIAYREHEIGTLAIGRELDEEERSATLGALAHYGAAFANQMLNEEARRDADAYCATLQALEQGIVLFQEEDAEVMKARWLHQAMQLVGAAAGVLYVLRQMGDPVSGLVREQVFGLPEVLLEGLHGDGGAAWPDALLGQPTQVAERLTDGSLARLAPDCVPTMLRNLAVVPLRYHGIEAGLCLLFNPRIDGAITREVAGRLQSFGLLGAALLHRLRLEEETALNRSRDRELQIARTIQQRLLPSHAPATPGFTYAWDVITAQNIGGDYVDVFESRERCVSGIVADASGHGINSALLMSSFRSTYRARAPQLDTDLLAATLNEEVVHEVGPTGMFITAAIYHLDCANRRLHLTSAGHTPGMLYRAATGLVELLDSDGPPLGFLAGVEYTRQQRDLLPGDIVLFYTDGISEAANADLDMYGEDRLAALLRRHAHGTAEQVLAAARTDLAAFTGRDRYDDDVSLTVIRVG